MNIKRISLLIDIFLIASAAPSQSRPDSAFAEQTIFSAEDYTVKRPVPLSNQLVSILLKDPDVQEVLSNEGLPISSLPKSWFLVSEVHLGGPDERDLVVIAAGRLQGANVTTYWIFRAYPGGLVQLLKAPAHTIVIKNQRSKGYKNVELMSATSDQVSTTLCRFNGTRYVPTERKLEKIK